jgi:lipoate-protein ligase B
MTSDLQDSWIANLGHANYLKVLDLQRELVKLRQGHRIPDTLLLVEHEPVITLGRRGSTSNILSSSEQLASQGIKVRQVERGGDVTYHGPGQLVGYPVIDLAARKIGVRQFVDLLEETIILTLADFDLQAGRQSQHRGVWVEDRKVAALGVAIKRWVSFHGFALNVSPNLDHYCHINPCELQHEQVTSMARLLGKPPSMLEVGDTVMRKFAELFPARWREVSPAEVFGRVQAEDETARAGVNPAPTILAK